VITPEQAADIRTRNSNKESVRSIGRSYDIIRTIRMSKEERRIQCLHDMANIFEGAFGGEQ